MIFMLFRKKIDAIHTQKEKLEIFVSETEIHLPNLIHQVSSGCFTPTLEKAGTGANNWNNRLLRSTFSAFITHLHNSINVGIEQQ